MKMNIPSIKNFGTTVFKYALFVLVSVVISAGVASGQTSEAQPPNLDQCANGKAADGPPVACSGAAWQNGNLNENNSQWVEGQFVPYRVVITAASPGENIVGTIQWDTTEGPDHAIDYIGTHDASNPSDPCTVVVNACGAMSTFPIPLDPRVLAAGVTQQPGFFTIWGGTITNVSAYLYEGPADYSGTTKAGLTLTIVADNDAATSLVIAWSGHISSRIDWGIGNTAIDVEGSPYHMRIVGTGNQDRSMSVAGVIFPALFRVVKTVATFNFLGVSDQIFGFTATPTFLDANDDPVTSFSLVDNNTGADIQNGKVLDFVTPIRIEEQLTPGWSAASVTCVETDGGLGVPRVTGLSSGIPQLPALPFAQATLLEGAILTCTFHNVQANPTAIDVSVEGRVTDINGRGLASINVVLTDGNTGERRTTTTNRVGFFRFEDLEIGHLYFLNAANRRFSFNEEMFILNDNLSGVALVGNPR